MPRCAPARPRQRLSGCSVLTRTSSGAAAVPGREVAPGNLDRRCGRRGRLGTLEPFREGLAQHACAAEQVALERVQRNAHLERRLGIVEAHDMTEHDRGAVLERQVDECRRRDHAGARPPRPRHADRRTDRDRSCRRRGSGPRRLRSPDDAERPGPAMGRVASDGVTRRARRFCSTIVLSHGLRDGRGSTFSIERKAARNVSWTTSSAVSRSPRGGRQGDRGEGGDFARARRTPPRIPPCTVERVRARPCLLSPVLRTAASRESRTRRQSDTWLVCWPPERSSR